MNGLETFLTTISHGNYAQFLRSISGEYVDKEYKHKMAEHGVIKVEYVDKNGHQNLRPIHLACDRGSLEIVKTLIEYECHLDTASKIGNNPLHIAASRGHWEIVALLLQQGAAIDSVNQKGQTALHLSAEYDNVKAAKVLMLKGVNIDRQDSRMNTALRTGEIFNNETIVTVIKEWGTLLEFIKNSQQERFKGLLKLSVFKKFYVNTEVCIKAVTQYFAKAEKDKSLEEIINELRFYHYISAHQNDHWLMYADIEAINNIYDRYHALEYCLNIDDMCPSFLHHFMQLILDISRMEVVLGKMYGIVENFPNKNVTSLIMKRLQFVRMKIKASWNRLHFAVYDDRSDMLEYILANHLVDMNELDETGTCPLFLAVNQGHIECVKLLLFYGADINITNKYGQNLIQVAILNGMENLIRPIIDYIRNPESCDCLGQSALEVAIKFGNESLCDQLITKYKTINQAPARSRPGKGKDEPTNQGFNMATLCLKVRGLIYPCIIRKMSDQGLEVVDDCGNSLLHLAAWQHSAETCRGLTEGGVDVNLQNDQGNTALHEVISAFLIGHYQNEDRLVLVIRTLVNAGASINVFNVARQTPLQLALHCINNKIVKEMTKSSTTLHLEKADIERVFSEEHYSLMVDLVTKMGKDKTSEILTEDFLCKCSEVLTREELEIIANITSTKTQESLLHRILSSNIVNTGNVALLHSILQNQSHPIHQMRSKEIEYPFFTATNDDGQSAMHIAAEHSYLHLVEIILGHLHTCSGRDNNGNTALGLLLCNNRVPLAEVEILSQSMIRMGADIYECNNFGNKVLDYCCDRQLRTNLELYYQYEKQNLSVEEDASTCPSTQCDNATD